MTKKAACNQTTSSLLNLPSELFYSEAANKGGCKGLMCSGVLSAVDILNLLTTCTELHYAANQKSAYCAVTLIPRALGCSDGHVNELELEAAKIEKAKPHRWGYSIQEAMENEVKCSTLEIEADLAEEAANACAVKRKKWLQSAAYVKANKKIESAGMIVFHDFVLQQVYP
jgi:hypothetical protein